MTKQTGIKKDTALKIYETALLIRKVELKIEDLYHEDEMKTPVHLSLGQEASAAGVCANLKKEDYVFSNHRSHAHYLAKGGNLKAMIAELYCKETGCSKGRGGSMHLIDVSAGLLGSSSIVGGSVPHAVGAAFAAKLKKEKRVAVTFFGDAATEEGVLFESMNFAQLKKVPVVFVCEHNYYSVCSHLSARQATDDIYMRPKAFNIPSVRVDGMDAIKVYKEAKKAIERARKGKGPYFIENVVQRWRAHSGAGDPIAEKYRHPMDLDEKKKRCPIKILEAKLIKSRLLSKDKMVEIGQKIDEQVEEAFKFAKESPLPDKRDLEKYLYF